MLEWMQGGVRMMVLWCCGVWKSRRHQIIRAAPRAVLIASNRHTLMHRKSKIREQGKINTQEDRWFV